MSSTSPNQPAAAVPLMLTGGRVTAAFRASLFDAADRAGVSVNEFVISAAAEKLSRSGASFPGVFPGDCHHQAEAA